MKNIHNALSDVLEHYKFLNFEMVNYVPEDSCWVIKVYEQANPTAFLEIEVIDDNGVPKCCVLQKVNVGRRSMFKFMNRLVDALDT
jgi:hypothetical protein